MGLPRSTYYDAPVATADEAEIVARIEAICEEFEAYGYRRVGATRCAAKASSSRHSKKVRRLMREHACSAGAAALRRIHELLTAINDGRHFDHVWQEGHVPVRRYLRTRSCGTPTSPRTSLIATHQAA